MAALYTELLLLYDPVSSSRQPGLLLFGDTVSGGGHTSPIVHPFSVHTISCRWVLTEDGLEQGWVLSTAVTQALHLKVDFTRIKEEIRTRGQVLILSAKDLWNLRPAESQVWLFG